MPITGSPSSGSGITVNTDVLAREVIGVPYATLSADNQSQVTAAATAGATRVDQYAQHFVHGGTSDTPTAWLNWAQAEASLVLNRQFHPERLDNVRADCERMSEICFQSYANMPSNTATIGGLGQTITAIRQFVIAQCVRQQRRLWVDPATIDPTIEQVMGELWNSAAWVFRRRPVTMRISVATTTTATWAQGTLTLTQTGAFTDYAFADGDRFVLTSGTGAVVGDYRVASRTSNDAVVLTGSLSAAAANLTTGDIVGTLVSVRLFGLAAAERFDSCATRGWAYDDNNVIQIEWIGADEMARVRSLPQYPDGRPRWFRMTHHGQNATGQDVFEWNLRPTPDATYTLRGDCYIKGPTLPTTVTNATDTVTTFPTDFWPVIRDITLNRVLESHGRTVPGERTLRVNNTLERLVRQYAAIGAPTDDQRVRDVYEDNSATMVGFGDTDIEWGGW